MRSARSLVWSTNSLVISGLVFIYSCPSNSPIKDRMVYSSGVSSTYLAGKTLLLTSSTSIHIASRKIETSSPEELDEEYLKEELELGTAPTGEQRSDGGNGILRDGNERRPFAKPRGPTRKW